MAHVDCTEDQRGHDDEHEVAAQEVRAGKVRVELALADKSSFHGTLEHGMPGTLEVAVERVSPLGLTLRTAGQWLTRPL